METPNPVVEGPAQEAAQAARFYVGRHKNLAT